MKLMTPMLFVILIEKIGNLCGINVEIKVYFSCWDMIDFFPIQVIYEVQILSLLYKISLLNSLPR